MSADLYFTGILLLSFFLFFAAYISELAERNLTKIGHVPAEVTAIWKRMSKIWGIPSPYKSEAQKPQFLEDFAT